MTDWDLVDAYVRNRSEPAFAGIIERHWRMVLAVCRREVGAECLAEDAAQLTFLVLARRARHLNRRGALASWLFVTARLTAKNVARQEDRRKAMEKRASEMAAIEADSAKQGWPEIEPHLDNAVASLRPMDRSVVLLRYYEDFSTADAARYLGVSEVAVRVRLSRAVERLRQYFKRQGFFFTDIALAALLAERAAPPAHASYAASLAHLAAGSGTGPISPDILRLLHLLKGVQRQMFIAKLKLAVAVFGILAVAGAGAGSIVHAVLPKISPASSSSSAALEARLHWAPVANGTQRYSASDLRVSVSVKTAGAPPINLVGIDEHGDVLGWYRTAQPKPGGGYTKYGATSFVVARGLFQLFVDVEFVALDGSGHVYALLNPTSGFNDLVYKISPAGRLGKPILLILKGKTTGDPLDSLYGEGQIDISKLMPANLKPNVNIMASDYRGDLLLDGSPSSDQLAYFAICHGRQAVDLHAYDAHMNHKGEIAIALMGKHEFAIYSCATGTERIIPQLTGLVQGGICAFNDNGDILYTTNNGHGVMDYYLISGSRVTKLDLPITVDPNQPLDGLLWMNDRHQIAGRIVLPDKRLHIFVLTPQG